MASCYVVVWISFSGCDRSYRCMCVYECAWTVCAHAHSISVTEAIDACVCICISVTEAILACVCMNVHGQCVVVI